MLNIRDSISRMLGGEAGNTAGVDSTQVTFKSFVKVTDGDSTPTVYNTAAAVIALITGTAHADFRKIWEKTVPAQQLVHWGYGSPALPYNQGYMWFAAIDKTTDCDDGILRVVQAKARETQSFVVAEMPDNSLHTSTYTTTATAKPTLQAGSAMAFPEKNEFPWIGQDSRLQLWYRLNVAATGHDDAGFDIPISVRQ